MQDWEQRLDYLEENNDLLRMQNRVLATALKAILRALPQDIAQDSIESIQAAFEDEIAELGYSSNHHADLFQDAAYEFFRDKS
ncbi:NGO1151 family protein [Neisseriaceae bacterium B1]